jgi:predicted nuclease of predicted toxin-antitoxin system
VPDFFTAEGYSVVTVQGEYGSKDVPDERWLHDAGVHGWVVVTKDSHIRQRPKEKSAFLKAKARVVCLTPGGLTMAEQVNCFRDNLGAIERWWDEPGPWLLVLRRGGVEKLSW